MATAGHAAACEADAITPAAPAPKPTNPRGDCFAPDVFLCGAASDSGPCPAGRTLVRPAGLIARLARMRPGARSLLA
jgi:hypothetical protein